jgi:hypothetical protein
MPKRERPLWRRLQSRGEGSEAGYSGEPEGAVHVDHRPCLRNPVHGLHNVPAGAFGALMLFFEEVSKTGRVPFRYYAMMIGLISGGLGMIGIGQGLRLLLLILGKE